MKLKSKDSTKVFVKIEETTEPKRNGRKRKRVASASATASDEESIEQLCKDILKEDNDEDHGKYETYTKDKKWKLDGIPHHQLPSFNLTQCTDINDLRDFPLAQVSLPHSVYVCSKQVNNIDICHRRVIAWNTYILRLIKVKALYFSAKKKSKRVRKNEKNGIYHRSLMDFAKRRDIIPDEYFAKDYDFYYTGGNLCANPETKEILHASGNKMETLILSKFTVENDMPKVYQIATVDMPDSMKDESEIFEMQFSKSENDCFFVRRKLCVSLHQHTGSKLCTKQKFCSKKAPFISFAQDKVNTGHLAISNLMHQVRVYDVEKCVPIQTYKLMPDEEIKPATNWNVIRSWDSNVYLYASCRKLNIIDTRVPVSEWQSNYCGYDDEDACGNFCSLAVSNFDNLFYVGSNHKVYCVDRRYMGKNIESKNCSVSRWTHQLSSSPLMMATTRRMDCEYIILQSPLSVDMRICENIQILADYTSSGGHSKKPKVEFPSEYNYKSPCLPFMPPSLESVFHEARKNGKCIKPNTGIVNRIKACNTGLSFVDDSSNSFILTSTSCGDLFARQIFDPDEDDCTAGQASAADVMSQFEENVYRTVKKSPLKVTDVYDLSGISKVFRCPILSNINPAEDTLTSPPKRKYMGRWQKSLQKLQKYKDALVPDLLSIWDIEEEEKDQRDFSLFSVAQNTLSDSTSLVSGWLSSTQEISHSAIHSSTTTALEELYESNVFEETLKPNDDSRVSQLESTVVASKTVKTSKKKSRYIKGF